MIFHKRALGSCILMKNLGLMFLNRWVCKYFYEICLFKRPLLPSGVKILKLQEKYLRDRVQLESSTWKSKYII